MEIYKDNYGNDCITITNENGTTWSGLKSAWDKMQAAQATLVTESAPTA